MFRQDCFLKWKAGFVLCTQQVKSLNTDGNFLNLYFVGTHTFQVEREFIIKIIGIDYEVSEHSVAHRFSLGILFKEMNLLESRTFKEMNVLVPIL